MNMRFAIIRGLSVVLIMGYVAAVEAVNYSITGFNYPTTEPTLRYSTIAKDINDAGQAVGIADNVANAHGWLYNRGTLTDLGLFNADKINNSGQILGRYGHGSPFDPRTYVLQYETGVITAVGEPGFVGRDMNDAGQVAGSYVFSNFPHAALYSNGTLTDLGTLPGHGKSEALAINNNGQVAGNSYPVYDDGGRITFGQPHAFLYSNGTMTDLGTLGSSNSFATNINNLGQVVGYSELVDTSGPDKIFVGRAFLYDDGVMTSLGMVNEGRSLAMSVNDLGQVVGNLTISLPEAPMAITDAPFLYENGNMVDLNSLLPGNSDWKLWYAVAINNDGQILGKGNHGAFIMTPVSSVPLPSTAWLMGSALLALLGLRGKSRSA